MKLDSKDRLSLGIYTSEERIKFLYHAVHTLLDDPLNYEERLIKLGRLIVSRLADRCLIYTIGHDNSLQRLAAAAFDPSKEKLFLKITRKYVPDKTLEDHPIRIVLRTGKALFFTEVSEALIQSISQNTEHLRILKKLGFKSMMIIPLKARKNILGALVLILSDSNQLYSTQDMALAQELADIAALAVDNARLYQEARTEIIERTKTEEALNQSKESYRHLFENIPTGIYRTTPEGQILLANSALINMLGFESFEELAQRNLEQDGFGPDYKRSWFKQLLDHEGEVKGLEYVWKTKDGAKIIIRENVKSIQDREGHIIYYEGTVEDITERKLLEKQKDEFIDIASHELKTPLTTLKAYAQILEEHFRGSNDSKANLYLYKLNQQINKLTDLVHDLLDSSKFYKGSAAFRTEVFEIDELIDHIVEEIQYTTAQKIIIDKTAGQKLIKADKYRIGQVLTNLISNAIKYSPNTPNIRVFSRKEGDKIIVAVEDFGIGIPKHTQNKIFEPYFRVSGPKRNNLPGGLGLGLYISCEIIKRHKGKIWFTSTEGKGSTFYFSLKKSKGRKNHE